MTPPKSVVQRVMKNAGIPKLKLVIVHGYSSPGAKLSESLVAGVGRERGAFLKVTSRTCRGGRLSDRQVMSVEGEKRDDGCLLEF